MDPDWGGLPAAAYQMNLEVGRRRIPLHMPSGIMCDIGYVTIFIYINHSHGILAITFLVVSV